MHRLRRSPQLDSGLSRIQNVISGDAGVALVAICGIEGQHPASRHAGGAVIMQNLALQPMAKFKLLRMVSGRLRCPV